MNTSRVIRNSVFLAVAAMAVTAFTVAKAYTWVVTAGDTLSGIAKKTDTKLADVVRANPQIRNPDIIRPGDKVSVPKTASGEMKMGAGYTPVTGYQSRTTSYISASASTIPVASTLDRAGNAITMASMSPTGTMICG